MPSLQMSSFEQNSMNRQKNKNKNKKGKRKRISRMNFENLDAIQQLVSKAEYVNILVQSSGSAGHVRLTT